MKKALKRAAGATRSGVARTPAGSETEKALRESKERLAKTEEIAHLGNWEYDVVSGRLTWSDEMYRNFGLRPGEIVPTYEAFMCMVHPDDREAVDKAYMRSVQEGSRDYEIKHRIVRPASGEVRFIREKCENILDADGRVVRSVGIMHDITEQKRAEEVLEEAYGALEIKVAQRTHELVAANRQLRTEMIERADAERRTRFTNELLALLGKTYTRREYLHAVVERLREWTGCRCAGIRIDETGSGHPDETTVGFEQAFRERDELVSLVRDACACAKPSPQSSRSRVLSCWTPGGSFRVDDAQAFVETLPAEHRDRLRQAFFTCGHASMAVVPIRFKSRPVGSIHLADESTGKLPLKRVFFVESLAAMISEGIHRLDMEERIRHTHLLQKIVNALLELSLRGAGVEELMNRGLAMLLSIPVLGFQGAGCAFLADPETGTLSLAAHRGLTDEEARRCLAVPPGECTRGEAIAVRDIVLAPCRAQTADDGTAAAADCLYAPIMHGERELGALVFRVGRNFRRDQRKDEYLREIARALGRIVAHIRTERKLDDAQRELLDARRLSDIGALAATVAHELRNPLGVMKAALYNLRRKVRQPGVERHVKHIEDKIAESSRIIEDLLFYARIKKPRNERVDCAQVLDECLREAEARFEGQTVQLVREYDGLRGLSIWADPLQLGEVFNNIINNAYQAIEAVDGVDGRIEVLGTLAEDGHIVTTVRDNGGGIAAEDLGHVFDPFFTRKRRGTGLGLAICRELMHLHKGDISIESEQGEGTSVHVRIPRGG